MAIHHLCMATSTTADNYGAFLKKNIIMTHGSGCLILVNVGCMRRLRSVRLCALRARSAQSTLNAIKASEISALHSSIYIFNTGYFNYCFLSWVTAKCWFYNFYCWLYGNIDALFLFLLNFLNINVHFFALYMLVLSI